MFDEVKSYFSGSSLWKKVDEPKLYCGQTPLFPGLMVVLGQVRSGKSVFLNKISDSVVLYGEPIDRKLTEKDVEQETFDKAVDYAMSTTKLIAVDSARLIIENMPGNALKGGLSSQNKIWLTELNNLAVKCNRIIPVAIAGDPNVLYATVFGSANHIVLTMREDTFIVSRCHGLSRTPLSRTPIGEANWTEPKYGSLESLSASREKEVLDPFEIELQRITDFQFEMPTGKQPFMDTSNEFKERDKIKFTTTTKGSKQ